MGFMADWETLATDGVINKTIDALKVNGIEAFVVESGEEAKKKVLDMIPHGDEVMTMTSVTLDSIGLTAAINESGNYDAVKPKLFVMNRETQAAEMQKLGAASKWSIGSVHSVTQDGKVLIASNTGSQLPGYAYGSEKVVWVVGAQKIAKDFDNGLKRVYDYVLPMESKRAHKAYGVSGSFVSKLLVVNREINPDRIKIIFVKESLGF